MTVLSKLVSALSPFAQSKGKSFCKYTVPEGVESLASVPTNGDELLLYAPITAALNDVKKGVLKSEMRDAWDIELPFKLKQGQIEVEEAAIAASLPILEQATLIVHLVAPDVIDPGLPAGIEPEEGVLRVGTKSDLPRTGADDGSLDHRVSALEGVGIGDLAQQIGRAHV